MSYHLKRIRYHGKEHHILLQNENGPCPLLAAANCLLLKGTIDLPSNCIGAGAMTIDQVVNVLAEKILINHSSGAADHHVQEVLTIFPSLQTGMDINPKFTCGPNGVEYTMHLNAFDLLHIELVHGWLLEPDAEEYDLIGNLTYNQLVNLVIEGNDAAARLENENPPSNERDELSTKATKGSIVKHFLDRSGHQLTQYGLTVLHEYMKDGQLAVFFRNNHFNTVTKHDGLLYLLVTDFGYSNVQCVVWEKLDVIDGDTEYVNEDFKTPSNSEATGSGATPAAYNSGNLKSQADYQLALQLSEEATNNRPSHTVRPGTAEAVNDDAEMEAARRASVEEYNRRNPESMIPFESDPPTNGALASTQHSYLKGLEQRVHAFGENFIQAGASLPDRAVNMVQPMGLNAPQPTGTPVQSSVNATPQSNHTPQATIAQGLPSVPPPHMDQDQLLAMQLQEEENNPRANPATSEVDRNLAIAMTRREREKSRHRVSMPGPPPARSAMAPPNRNRNDEKCIVS